MVVMAVVMVVRIKIINSQFKTNVNKRGKQAMECKKCNSKELEDKLICTNYIYNNYFERDIRIDTIEIKCKKCEYKWIEVIQLIKINVLSGNR